MSRELRKRLEDAEQRFMDVKRELSAPPDPKFLAREAELLAVLEPVRAEATKAEKRRDAARAEALKWEHDLAAHKIDKRATYSRNQIGPWFIILPLLLALVMLIGWASMGISGLTTSAILLIALLAAFGLGFYLAFRVMGR